MKQYLQLIETVLTTGVKQTNRTGIPTLFIPGHMLKFDLRDGFPAVTTKKLAFQAVIGELIGFLRGYDNASDFRNLKCKIWDQNANENEQWLNNPYRKGNDDLGRIYGKQWTDWRTYRQIDGYEGNKIIIQESSINQVYHILEMLFYNPTDRRMLISGWRPDEFDQMALPPCHVLYQFIADVDNNVLHLCMTQRSCDLFLGVPFNIASCAALLTLIANLSGYTPGTFTHFMGNVHIYENHIEQCKLQLQRTPHALPTLEYTGPKFTGTLVEKDIFNKIQPDDFKLVNYVHDGTIPAPMAV
jgi:thymidylate synthase